MWTWLKTAWSDVWTFLKPLVRKLLTKTGTLVCDAAVIAVKEVAANTSSTASWTEKLQAGVYKAVAELEAQGLKLGVDFFLNEVIASITAAIAKNYEDTAK